MKRRTLIILVAVVAVAAVLVAWGLPTLRRNRPEENTALVQRGTFQASVDALGRVQPKQQMAVYAESTGRVLRVLVQEGQKVEKGQLLMEMDDREYVEQVRRAESSLELQRMQLDETLEAPSASQIAQARTRLRVATALRQNAQEEYDKIAERPDAESSNEAINLERAKLEYELADTEFQRLMEGASTIQVQQIRANVENAKWALAQAREALQKTDVHAPMAGTVMQIEAQEGLVASRNNPAFVIADLDALQIRADIDELDVPFVAEGQKVEIRLDAFPAQLLEGAITHLAPGVDDTRNAAIYPATINLDHAGLAVRPGMGANLRIITQSAEDVLLVPKRAIRSVGRYEVAHVRVGQQTLEVIVTTGLSNDEQVQILSGLEEGQRVVLN